MLHLFAFPQLKDISQKSAEYEIKLKELEDKHKKSEKLLSAKKEKVSKLEKQVSLVFYKELL